MISRPYVIATRWLAMTVVMTRHTLTRHRPRKRTIQYSETPMMESRSRSVLDAPHARGMTALCGAAPSPSRLPAPAIAGILPVKSGC
jgi:hypothetical protein